MNLQNHNKIKYISRASDNTDILQVPWLLNVKNVCFIGTIIMSVKSRLNIQPCNDINVIFNVYYTYA